MMKYIITSDTHGTLSDLEEILEMEDMESIDGIIHLGDAEGQSSTIEDLFQGKACIVLRGNCDYNSYLEDERCATFGNHRIFMTHGHMFGVNQTRNVLRKYARDNGCDIALYGHTHKGMIEEFDDGFIAANPGSPTYPRGCEPSYIVMTVDQGEVDFELKYI